MWCSFILTDTPVFIFKNKCWGQFLSICRVAEHDYLSQRAYEERKRRPNYRPILEHDGLRQQSFRQVFIALYISAGSYILPMSSSSTDTSSPCKCLLEGGEVWVQDPLGACVTLFLFGISLFYNFLKLGFIYLFICFLLHCIQKEVKFKIVVFWKSAAWNRITKWAPWQLCLGKFNQIMFGSYYFLPFLELWWNLSFAEN